MGFGMRAGQEHYWQYTEKKYRQKGNKFTIEQSKGRNEPSPKGSGMPLKSKLIWKIKGTETIGRPRKVKGYKGYMTPVIIRGTKLQGAFKLPKSKWIKSKMKKAKRAYKYRR